MVVNIFSIIRNFADIFPGKLIGKIMKVGSGYYSPRLLLPSALIL